MRTSICTHPHRKSMPLRSACRTLVCVAASMLLLSIAARADTVASLLGNFTINQYCGLNPGSDAIRMHYVIVFGQLPALRELHNADANGDGVTSQAERDAYVGKLAPGLADGLQLRVDGVRIPLRATAWSSSLPVEQGGFSLRVDMDLAATYGPLVAAAHTVQFSNQNYAGRMGWHEIVITPDAGLAVFDTDAFSTSATGGLSEALQSLPDAGPLDERTVHLSMAHEVPAGAVQLAARSRAGLPVVRSQAGMGSSSLASTESAWITRKTRQLVDAISSPQLDPRVALWALLGALLLGAVHALSPGHGKTIVGAYLIGSRGTPRHAVFLGFTVTVTHTIGVFVLGFATLYASRFIVPERLFPILSMVSALLVLGMGVLLLVQRARIARGTLRAAPGELVFEAAAVGAGTRHTLMLAAAAQPLGMHSHDGGPMHSHLPPGATGERITWKSLLALGISGGLVPCPSAMVLLLAAIALNKTAYGMLLVLVFSLGLAVTLTVVGLVFLFARSRLRRPHSTARWPALLPVLSAATITVVGAVLCVGALKSFG